MSNALNKTFNVSSEVEVITKDGDVIVPNSQHIEENVETDYEHTRANLYNLLRRGEEALTNALKIANGSEHPRAFEVVGNLIKQLSEVNNQLLDLTEKRNKLMTPQTKAADPGKTVNAFFVGSTAELNKMLRDMNNSGENR